MNIIIVGGGKVGVSIARQLSMEDHDVTVVDQSEELVDRISNSMDVICCSGNGASFPTLKSVGVENCDLLVAVTGSDELNMFCCMCANKLGARNTIARIRNPEYSEQLYEMKRDLGLSMFVNPERLVAMEIARVLRFPSASRVELFAKGKVELVSAVLPEGNVLCGKKLSGLTRELGISVLICAVEREDETFIPGGDFVLCAGDEVYFTGTPRNISHAFKVTGLLEAPVKSVMIAGGGKVAFYLSKILEKQNMRVKIIERDRQVAEELAEALPGAVILQGDITDHDILLEEGISSVDAFVGLTGIDEANIFSALYAERCSVPKVIVKVNNDNMMRMTRELGIDSLISPKLVMTNEILRYVRAVDRSGSNSEIMSLYKIVGGKAEVLEFAAEGEIEGLTGIALKDLKVKKGILIACIIRGSRAIIPGGGDSIIPGDGVLVVTANGAISSLAEIVED